MTPKIITGKKGEEGKRGRGRPAVFDRAVALQAAMKLFWERGYEGTSFDDLIAAMGISASSFYNSFGSKEALYCEATRSYLEWSGQWFFAILNDPSIDTQDGLRAAVRGDRGRVHPRRSPARLHDFAGGHALPAGHEQHPRHDGRASRLFGKRDGGAHPQGCRRMATCPKIPTATCWLPITAPWRAALRCRRATAPRARSWPRSVVSP